MIEKYAKSGLFNSVNLDHDDDRFTDSVYMIESYTVNRERGIIPLGFEDIPDGSWICSFKVEDESLWKEIIGTDHFNGFSLQGVFELAEKEQEFTAQQPSEIDQFINDCLN